MGKINKGNGQQHGGNDAGKTKKKQPTATPSAQLGHRELYSDWALAALMGYVQVYTEAVIPNGIKIDTAVFEEMVNKNQQTTIFPTFPSNQSLTTYIYIGLKY